LFRCVSSRVTWRVCEKIAQNVAQPIICQNLNSWKSNPTIWATSVIFKKNPA
jgi:hypothetical protein